MEWLWILCTAVAISALMSHIGIGKRTRERPPDDLWEDEIPIPPCHPLVPDEIQEAAEPYCAAGCTLHRTQTRTGIEWWLIDPHGELVNTFWLEEQQLR